MKPVDFCNQHNPCITGRTFALRYQTMFEVWEACKRSDWLLWITQKCAPLKKEKAVQLAVEFAESCLHLVPQGELRPRAAVEAAKVWLADPSEENRVAALEAAKAARASSAAAHSAIDAAYSAADAVDNAAVYWTARAAIAATDASSSEVGAACAHKEICDIIRRIIPNPFSDQ